MKICVISPRVSRISAYNLASELNASFVQSGEFSDFSKFDVVFNYGSSSAIRAKKIINSPTPVAKCINKLSTFSNLNGKCNLVPFTTRKDVAIKWIEDGNAVVIRTKVDGKRGEGVSFTDDTTIINSTPAEFYTKFIPSIAEIRVNVYKDNILTIYHKKEDNGFWEWIPLAVEGEHKEVSQMIGAISKNIGIDFYGLDILVTEDNECVLLEVNSGPTLQEETLSKLAANIKKEFK